MTEELLIKASSLLEKKESYKRNLDTFRNKDIHQIEDKRAPFKRYDKIKGWFVERIKTGEAALKTSYEGGGAEFIGYISLDQEDMDYMHQYMQEKYQKICNEFNSLN